MKLILHPGHSKCGSSSIQQFLYDNKKVLLANGYAIPDLNLHFQFEKKADFSTSRPAVGYLALANKNKELPRLKTRLLAAIKNGKKAGIHTFIISAENLGGPIRTELNQTIANCFKTTKVIYYLRRQDDFLLSAWQQWGFKMGKTLEEYCNKSLERKDPNYLKITQLLESTYGKTVLEVVPFNREVFYENDLILDFMHRTGLDKIQDIKDYKRVLNKSLSPLVCEFFIQHKNLLDGPHGRKPETGLEQFKTKEPWLFSTAKSYASAALRNKILNRFETDNRKLQQNYFPEIPYALVFGSNIKEDQNILAEHRILLEKFKVNFLNQWIEEGLPTKQENIIKRVGRKMKSILKGFS